MINLEVVNYSNQFLNLAIVQNGVMAWVLTLVYASPIDDARYMMWENLIMLHSAFTCPWRLIGDFNEVISQDDKQGGRRFLGNKGLSKVVELCELMELPSSEPKFT